MFAHRAGKAMADAWDPTYLLQPVPTGTHFKKQADSTGWNPAACTAR
jgi:hypothetical protein